MRMIPIPTDGEELLMPFLELCVNWSPDRPTRDVDLIRDDQQLHRYVAGWGRDGDLGVMAVPEESVDGSPVGAAWIRTFVADPGFGWVSDDIPELSVAVLPEHQGEGIGRRLAAALAQMARLTGVEAISLAVEETNGARHLYAELGFVSVGRNGNSDVMLLDLSARG